MRAALTGLTKQNAVVMAKASKSFDDLITDMAAYIMPCQRGRYVLLHALRPVYLKKNRLLHKTQQKCKVTPKMLGMPTIWYGPTSPLFEIARKLVCLDHAARVIANADHGIV